MKRVYSLLIVSTIVFSLSAQSSDYQKRAAQIRAEVWAWDNPAFKNYNIPDEFKNESSVILVRHRQIDATANKSSLTKEFFLGSKTGKLFYTDIDRRMIKINDQTALNRYSEFSFQEEYKDRNPYSRETNLNLTILGVRIIKPNGLIKEINVPESTVTISEGKGDKKAYNKLAIPELQINDILDVFICDVYELETYNIPEQFIPFYSIDCPALKHSCSLIFGKNLTIEYRSINGAPEFSKETDKNGNIVLTAESDTIRRINDVENIRWLSSLRNFPMIRLFVLQNASKVFYKPQSARPIGVHENVSCDNILEDSKYFLAFNQSRLSAIKDTPKKAIETIDNYLKVKPDISKEELANIIYTALNFEWRGGMSYFYTPSTFILTLDNLFKKYDIDSKVGFVTSKYSARRDEVATSEDLYYMIAANNATQYFFLAYRYRIPGEIPAGFQGESASIFTFQKISANDITYSVNVDGYWSKPVVLPESSVMDNTSKMLLNISFNSDDMQKIDIERHSIWSGNLKSDIQPQLLLFEDWDRELRIFLMIDKSYIDELNAKKSTRKLISEVEGSFEKSREKYAEKIENEIILYHGSAPENVKNYSFSSLGVTLEKPHLEYDISYTMKDFVRNAGDNIILDVGKLIGEQWNPTENERKRDIDAYIPTRRVFEREIVIEIPDKYIASDIDRLNMSFSNEYVSFEVISGIENNAIKIKVVKTYNQVFIPKEKWCEMIDIIDKTNEFCASSIIFKRKAAETPDEMQ